MKTIVAILFVLTSCFYGTAQIPKNRVLIDSMCVTHSITVLTNEYKVSFIDSTYVDKNEYNMTLIDSTYVDKYSVVEITNLSNEYGVLFFDKTPLTDDYGIFDFLSSRCVLEFVSLVTNWEDIYGSVNSFYSFFMKKIAPQGKFTIVVNSNDPIIRTFASHVRFVPYSTMKEHTGARVLTKHDSWFFVEPDILYVSINNLKKQMSY